MPGWINTDITPHIWLSRVPLAPRVMFSLGKMTRARFEEHRRGVFRHLRYLNVTKPFPIVSDSVSVVYTSHMLEHLYPWDAEHCLRECHRVLTPKGLLRIAIPDLDQMVSAFRECEPQEFLASIYEYGRGMDKNSHHWHYNFYSLSRLLRSLGFSSVERCQYQEGKCPDLRLIEHRPDSLFVEATR